MTLSESDRAAFSDYEKRSWDKAADLFHRHWGDLTAQSAEPLLDAAGVRAESKVLDIATGAGYVAAAAARRGAIPVGLDFSQSQVDLAHKTYPGIDFRQGDAEDLPFGPNVFDAIVMSLGLLHMPNAERALAEAYRVLKPGGFFAATVWAKLEENPAFRIVFGAIECLGSKVELPPAPPYFRFSDVVEAKRVLASAKFIEPQTKLVPQYWRHSSPDALFDAFHEGAVRAAAMLRAQSEEVRHKIKIAVRDQVLPLAQGEIYVIPAPVVMMQARKN